MATKKKSSQDTATAKLADEAYQAALDAFGKAVDQFGKGSYAEARDALARLIEENSDEIGLCSRARTYLEVCDRRLQDAPTRPETPEDWFFHGVVLLNDRRLDEAHQALDQAVQGDARNARVWYARASVRSLQGNVQGAVEDLRQAVTIDPGIRFQAINDADFDSIRDEAAFIDIVEPTPSEV
jgi:tetratricopeptide (TPR) repeat protein